MRRCKHLLVELSPRQHRVYYCKVFHTEIQIRETVRMCSRCMYYEEVDGDEDS